jgi:hypothetical protein
MTHLGQEEPFQLQRLGDREAPISVIRATTIRAAEFDPVAGFLTLNSSG